MADPPVAMVRSQMDISSCASGMLGLSTTEDEVLGRALLLQGGAEHARDFERGGPAHRMRREDDGVPALEALMVMLTIVTSGFVTGRRPAIRPDRLGVLHDALVGQLFDDADAPGPQRVAENPEDFPAACRHAVGAAHAAFFDAHTGESAEGLFVGGRPGNRAAQAIDGVLIVVEGCGHGDARAREQRNCADASLLGEDSGHGRHYDPSQPVLVDLLS